MGKLVLHVPGGAMRDVKLDRDRITIGRRADNDVCLPYPAVSAEHAAIVTVLDDSFLEDLQSTNGTLVNGNRVIKHFLRDHDTIDVGRVQLVYLVDEAEIIAPLESSTALLEPAASPELSNVAAEPSPDDDAGEEENVEKDTDDSPRAPVDDLLADLMDSDSDASVAVDIPPTISVVPIRRRRTIRDGEVRTSLTDGVFVEVMNGPNAGHIAPMTRREFVLGRAGATMAVIRRDDDRFALVPVDSNAVSSVNGQRVPPEGRQLAFGDTIDVAGVKLRFGRRPPL